MPDHRGSGRRTGAALVAVLVFTIVGFTRDVPTATADTAPVDLNLPDTVSADALPTVQINGVVWSQVIVGDRVFVTGEFTHARPAGAAPGVDETPRSNILAYDIHTGELVTSWAPTLDAQGITITASEDGSVIYVGGDFGRVNDQFRARVAAIDAQTGAVLPFNPVANVRVSAIAVDGNTLYMGGVFTTVGSQPRSRLAAVNATTGALLPWAPSADGDVVAMVRHPASGRDGRRRELRRQLNGVQQFGMGSLDGTTGALMPWAVNSIIPNRGSGSYISGLVTDGEMVYGIGWTFGGGGGVGNFEGTFAAHPAHRCARVGQRLPRRQLRPHRSARRCPVHRRPCARLRDWSSNFPQSEPWTFQRAQAYRHASCRRTASPTPSAAPNDWQHFPGPAGRRGPALAAHRSRSATTPAS